MIGKQRWWWSLGSILTAAVALLFCAVVLHNGPAMAQGTPSIDGPFYGYGADTTGGAGGMVVYVDTLADSGPGSLRDALSGEGRIVRFSVAGDISLSSELVIPSDITIDGFSAPVPGITIRDHRVTIKNRQNIIVQGLRFRGPAGDTLRIWKGAYDIVVDHCSFSGSTDGALDITEGSYNVTVSWNIIAKTGGSVPKPMLLKYGAYHISLFHNIFVENNIRNPEVGGHFPEYFGGAIDYQPPVADVRNNIVWNWQGVGTRVTSNAKSPGWEATANIVNNLYSSQKNARNAIIVYAPEPETVPAEAYVAGNVSLTDVTKAPQYQTGLLLSNVNDPSNHAEFPAADIGPGAQLATLEAAHQTYLYAGVRPLDVLDNTVLGQIDLPEAVGDATPPAIAITAPTATGSYQTEGQSVTIAGSAWDNEAVSTVECVKDNQTMLAVDGIDTWQTDVALDPGNNEIICTAYDSAGNSDSASLLITVVGTTPTDGVLTVEVGLASKTDDADEKVASGANLLNKGTLSMGKGRINALRFQLGVPPNAVVTEARLVFNCTLDCSRPIRIRYAAAAEDDAQAFSGEDYDISSRPRTAAKVLDNPAAWQDNQDNASADLTAIVQEIVSRSGWQKDNHMIVFVEDNGSGAARSIATVDKFPDAATKLLVRYGSLDSAPPPPALNILTGSLPGAAVGLGYSETLAVDGGVPPYSWTIQQGTLPAGLNLDNGSGVISGTPISPGDSTFTVRVSDAAGDSDTQQLVIAVADTTVPPPPDELITIEQAIASKADDAYEKLSTGETLLNKGSLVLGEDRLNGLRFQLAVPRNAMIAEARLVFNCRKTCNRPISLRFAGVAADDAEAFAGGDYNISARPQTIAEVIDHPDEWSASEDNFSVDIAPIVQEIVSRPGWEDGNSVVLLVDDNGNSKVRNIAAFDRSADTAAKLLVRYRP